MKRQLAKIIGLLSILALPATSAGAADDLKTIIEKANAEGSVIVRITNPSSPDTHAALEKAFNERFGTSIKLEWTPQGAPQTGARVIAEAGSGQGSVDLIGLGSAEDVELLQSRDLVKAYPWIEVFGAELPGIEGAVNEVMPDLRGSAFVLIDAVYGLGWNTGMIKEADLPMTTEDLVDPKWDGKLALNAFFLNPLPTLAYIVGQDAMLDYAKKVIKNHPILQRGSPVVLQAVSVGQSPLGIITYHGAVAATNKGEPIGFRLFDDYIMVYQGFIYMPENAPHPNATRLFTAWLVSEGFKIAAEHEPIPRLSDRDSDVSKMVSDAQAKTGAKIAMPTSLKDVAAQQELRDELTKLLTSSGN